MEALKHVEETRGSHFHRMECEFEVVNEEYVGVRGGRKIPLEIVWKTEGSGFATHRFKICGCAVLTPHVRYHNGNGKPRAMEVGEWVSLTGKGSWSRSSMSNEFKAQLEACDADKSVMGHRMATIVTNIVKNGGTVRITSR